MTSESQVGSDATQINCVHPRSSKQFSAEIDAATTGRDVINGLIEAGFIDPATGKDAYGLEHVRTHRSLPLSSTLVPTVSSGDTLQVVLAQAAAGSLSPSDLRSRLAFDHRVIRGMTSPILARVEAYEDDAAYRAGRALDLAGGNAGRASVYVVDYRMRTMVSPGLEARGATAVLRLLAGSDYPMSEPLAVFGSRPLPFSPHVADSGTVCLGHGWAAARGRMLAGQLICHLARILNFDWPSTHPGYSPAAYAFAMNQLKGRPIEPALEYPALPIDVAYGIGARMGAFRTATTAETARPVRFTGVRRFHAIAGGRT